MFNHEQKQWWAPVWKGLVMDAQAKHYRKMKNAVWLFLYLLVNANRATGVLMRKIKTISADMGVTRDTVIRWLSLLRKEGYIATVNTGRYLTIQVNNWKPLSGAMRTQPQKSWPSDTSSGKYPTPSQAAIRSVPVHFARKAAVWRPANNTNIQIILKNEMHNNIASDACNGAFKSIGFCAKQELLARHLAKDLDDPAGINLYRSYCQRYPPS